MLGLDIIHSQMKKKYGVICTKRKITLCQMIAYISTSDSYNPSNGKNLTAFVMVSSKYISEPTIHETQFRAFRCNPNMK